MKQVKTQKGKVLNMQALYDANQEEIAVGNANMNARGDVLGAGGKILIPKNKVTDAYYANNPNAVKEVSIKQDPDEMAKATADQVKAKKAQEARDRAAKQAHDKAKEQELAKEARLGQPVELDEKTKGRPEPVEPQTPDASASEIVSETIREREDGTKYREVEYGDGSMEELPVE